MSIDAISCLCISRQLHFLSLNGHFDRVAPDFHVGHHEADQYLYPSAVEDGSWVFLCHFCALVLVDRLTSKVDAVSEEANFFPFFLFGCRVKVVGRFNSFYIFFCHYAS